MSRSPQRMSTRVAALALGLLLIACGSPDGGETADLVLTGGRVYSLAWPDPAPDGSPAPGAPWSDGWQPDATALAVADGRIVAVGSDEQIAAWVGPETTRRVELGGAAVLPGLVESHAHAAGLGRNLRRVDLTGVETPAEAIERVVAAAPDFEGDWILGWGFDDGAWADRYPDNEALSEAVPDRPVLLRGLHGFAVWANDRALERAGIGADTPDPDGGRILRHPDGTPTGILLDRATALLADALPAETREVAAANLAAGLQELARSGYVAVHEAGVDRRSLEAMMDLEEAGELPIRVYAMLSARDADLSREWLDRGPRHRGAGIEADETSPRVVVRSVKAYYDAALGSRGARLLDDYSDRRGHRGTAGGGYGFDEELVAALMRRGFQVGIHAIGDAGNRETLDFLERVMAEHPEARQGRHRIEHAQVLHPRDLPRLAALGITAAMQPPHAVEDMDWAEDRIGPERIRGAYAWRSLLREGTRVIFSSDLPGSDHSIFYGLHAAVTRRDENRHPADGWYPDEAVTPEEAVRAYTTWAAWSAFQEERTGTLEPGKWADITVLRPDPLGLPVDEYGAVLDGEIVMTLVGGEVAFDAFDEATR